MLSDVNFDGLDQFGDTSKATAPDLLLSYVSKEALDHVEPGRTGGREMHVEAPVAFHPGMDLGMFVRGVVVANDVNLCIGRRVACDQVQEPDPFLMTVLGQAGVDDRSVVRVERGESVVVPWRL